MMFKSRGESYEAIRNLTLEFCITVTTGLEDGDQDTTDPTSIQGAYLSFLHLRHLRIRDLQRMVCDCDLSLADLFDLLY